MSLMSRGKRGVGGDESVVEIVKTKSHYDFLKGKK